MGVWCPLYQISILGPRKALDFGELQQPGRRGTTRFFGTRSKVSMDWAASAIKPGRRSLNRTSMDVRRARGAIKDPSGAECHDVQLVLLLREQLKPILLAPRRFLEYGGRLCDRSCCRLNILR